MRFLGFCLTIAVAVSLFGHRTARADLLALYTFDDGTAADSSGHENHGIIVGAPDDTGSGGAVDGLGYLTFFGFGDRVGGDYVQTPLDINPATAPRLTMGAWARVPDGIGSGIRQILAHDNGAWDRGIGTDDRGDFDGGGDGTFRWTGFTGNGPLGFTTPVAGTENEWVFIAAVYDAAASSTMIYIDDESFEGQAIHGYSWHNLAIAANPQFSEGWDGDIDNVFVFDQALSEAEIEAVRLGGPEIVLELGTESRTLLKTWDFEDGDLDGFDYVDGTAFDTQPTYGDNPLVRQAGAVVPFGTGFHGDYFIGTFENRPTEDDPEGSAQGDGPVGVIESAPFVLDTGAQFDLLVGGGNHPWDAGWDPDSAPIGDDGPTTVNLERQVGADGWEVISSATGAMDNEALHFVHWDASQYAGDTVRLRIYDNNTGGWGHLNLDYIRYFSSDAGTLGDYNDNGTLDSGDLDLQAVEIAGATHNPDFDLTGDGKVDYDDRVAWVKDLFGTWIGDANLDLEFNSGDMVQVFVKGKYETGEDAGWEEGDWNGDLKFGSGDMVAAFAAGGYEQGPLIGVVAVPEPSTLALFALGIMTLSLSRRWRIG